MPYLLLLLCSFNICDRISSNYTSGSRGNTMEHKGTVKLETERLELRKITGEDAKAMFEVWLSDSEVTKFSRQGAHKNLEEAIAHCDEITDAYPKEKFYYWGISVKETGELAGRINITSVDEAIESVCVSFMIGRAFWNRGYVSEALSAVVKFFFENVGVNRIEGRNDRANPSSGRVMVKNGFKYEGLLRRAGRNSLGHVDCEQYAIIAEDYFNPAGSQEDKDILLYKTDYVFSYRVAGVLLHEGKILLQKPVGDNAFAVPGGHVEFGETNAVTLQREFKEELGADITVGKLKWTGELFFPWGSRSCHQICLYYEVELNNESAIPLDGSFTGSEGMEFHWVKTQELGGLEVYPTNIEGLLKSGNTEHFIYRE